jgi:hypothetical protein
MCLVSGMVLGAVGALLHFTWMLSLPMWWLICTG